jgi:hypothetical protein
LIGRGRLLPHTGLLRPGAWVEFVFVLGGQEYKAWFTDGTSWWQQCLVDGVGASTTNTCSGRTTPAVVGVAADGNTSITAPPDSCREDR